VGDDDELGAFLQPGEYPEQALQVAVVEHVERRRARLEVCVLVSQIATAWIGLPEVASLGRPAAT
jgi:hypothetical protein